MKGQSPIFVYAAISDFGLLKIGQTSQPQKRLQALRCSAKQRVKFLWTLRVWHRVDAWHLEDAAIAMLKSHRLVIPKRRLSAMPSTLGLCEWFKPTSLGSAFRVKRRIYKLYKGWLKARADCSRKTA